MQKRITGLLALLLIGALMTGLMACGVQSEPEPTQEKKPIRIPEQVSYETCSELGTPLADVRVRQALAYAIDVDTIIEALYDGMARKAVSFTEPEGEEYPSYDYDPVKAKALLAEAGWPSDYVLDVVYYHDDGQTEDLLRVIGGYWEAVGVKVSFRKLEGDLTAQLWQVPDDPEGESGVTWDLAFGAIAALTEAEAYGRFSSTATNNSHTPEQEGLNEAISQGDFTRVRLLLAENASFIPVLHQDFFVYTSDHIDTGTAVHGNDQFVYEKDILNWTTDREDNTLYTDGGPESFFCDPTVNPGLYLYQELIFERLLNADSDLNPTDGQIAESYEISQDGKTLEFVIREELLWHDGEPLTAEDVKFTFELYLQCPGANSVLTDVLKKLEGAQALLDGDAKECSGIRVEDNRVIFQFDEPAEDALKVFSQWPILPEHKLEKVKPAKLQQNKFWKNPVGSGPYKVATVELGQYCILERWDGYRETGEGNIQYIYMLSSGETDGDLAVYAALGDIDYAWGKSTDDAIYIATLDDMTATQIPVSYTRCFYINQFAHTSGDSQEEPTE